MNKMRIILMILLLAQTTFGTIRYVSKTGSSTPPYISWETASDSIQKCLNICVDGDTVIVANGIYKESLIINAAITFIGSSMDSCVIDGRNLTRTTIEIFRDTNISGFNIFGKGIEESPYQTTIISRTPLTSNYSIRNCVISNGYNGLYFGRSSGFISNSVIKNVYRAIFSFCMSDTCKPKLNNSIVFISKKGIAAWYTGDGGQPTITNNILVTEGDYPISNSAASGIIYAYSAHKNIVVRNNLISGFNFNTVGTVSDTAKVINNVFREKQRSNATLYSTLWGVSNEDKVLNNIFMKNYNTINAVTQPTMDYNLFWENVENINAPYQLGINDIIADPMIVKDTLGYTLKGDYHLQMYSPGIDAGDSSILDIDGSRSDIGMFGGPLGQSYQYLDLPPNPPRNIRYTANINEKKIIFTWKKNSESDFKEYHVFRDTVQGFTPDSAHLYLILPDSTLGDTAQFIDTYSGENAKYYYRIIARDNQGNESSPSDEISVIITGIDIMDVEIATDYRLYQNYPNPFNPNTVIGYQLAVGSYVKVMVYDIKGEMLEVLVNENKPAGYYEVEFNAGKYASGIYLYRIEVIGEGSIPRFMDMKKMMLVK